MKYLVLIDDVETYPRQVNQHERISKLMTEEVEDYILQPIVWSLIGISTNSRSYLNGKFRADQSFNAQKEIERIPKTD